MGFYRNTNKTHKKEKGEEEMKWSKTIIIQLLIIMLLLLGCANNQDLLKVKVISTLTDVPNRQLCITNDNITITCIGCITNITQFCEYGTNSLGDHMCWC